LGPFSNIKGLTYHKDNSEDPYITVPDVCCLGPSSVLF
jgi:periodic tryptophan protein 1